MKKLIIIFFFIFLGKVSYGQVPVPVVPVHDLASMTNENINAIQQFLLAQQSLSETLNMLGVNKDMLSYSKKMVRRFEEVSSIMRTGRELYEIYRLSEGIAVSYSSYINILRSQTENSADFIRHAANLTAMLNHSIIHVNNAAKYVTSKFKLSDNERLLRIDNAKQGLYSSYIMMKEYGQGCITDIAISKAYEVDMNEFYTFINY